MGLTSLLAAPHTIERVLLIAGDGSAAAPRPPTRGGARAEAAAVILIVVVARPADVGTFLRKVARETRSGGVTAKMGAAGPALGIAGRRVRRLILLQKNRQTRGLHTAAGLIAGISSCRR